MTDTKDKILDAAEKSFSELGFAGTSVRAVVADAGVNLAAVHYHFGSKEELLRAVIVRRVEPVNRERLALLEQFEREAAPAPAALERVIEAFVAPTLRLARQPHGPRMIRLMGRMWTESDLLPRIIHSDFAPFLARFGEALQRSLPELPQEELYCTLYLAVGVMAQGLRAMHEAPLLSQGRCRCDDVAQQQERIISFMAAGFRSRSTK